ncbi:MAG: hypothetical protein J7L25_00320, partial [Deltaproteobacteria bacterium]|nr:hypothetical protein [Candidatus Tharpella aukensis]
KDCPNQGQVISFISINGSWNLNQDNGYTGIMKVQQGSNGHFTGDVIWNGYLKGTIDGNISGNTINITIDYHNGDIGYYKGTLNSNGTKIVNGSVKGNNGVSANWDAVKSNAQNDPISNLNSSPITGQWEWFTNVIVTIYPDNTVNGSNGGVGVLSQNYVGNQVEYVISWSNGYVDRLTLNGNTLEGKNQNGTPVWGKRIHSG